MTHSSNSYTSEDGHAWTLEGLLADLDRGDYLYLTPKMCADLARLLRSGPNYDGMLKAWNESIQRGLKHQFFKDGLEADTHELSPAEAYREGWMDAWLESADDLSTATERSIPNGN